MFVSTSGPSVANASSTHTCQPSCQSWPEVCGAPQSAIGTQARPSTTALSREGEYRRISGAISIE